MLTCDEGGTLVGMAYFVPKEFTDRVWELLMIAVDIPRHRQGVIHQACLKRVCRSCMLDCVQVFLLSL
jgi:cation transport regulator ChaC